MGEQTSARQSARHANQNARHARIVFCDMDGTFLASDKSIPPENFALLDELGARGIEFVPCTGRPVSAIPEEVRAHPTVHYAIAANGAIVEDLVAGKTLRCAPISKRSVLELYERVRDWPLTFDVFADGGVYSERARYDSMGSLGLRPAMLTMLRRVRQPVDLDVPQIVARAQYVEKITCFFGDLSVRERVVREADEVGGLSYACGDPSDVELMAPGVSKGEALEWLCGYVGIPVSCAVAFGDEDNDVSMLLAAGDGVAMANASESVRRHADHVAATNDEAGVARYLADCCF